MKPGDRVRLVDDHPLADGRVGTVRDTDGVRVIIYWDNGGMANVMASNVQPEVSPSGIILPASRSKP